MPQTNATFEKDIKACQAKSELAWILFLKALSRVASRNPKASPVTSNCPAGSAFKPTRLSQARCQLQMGCLHFTYWPLTFGYDIMGPVLTGVNRSCENREDVHGLLTIRTYKKWINGTDGALQVRLCSWQVFLFELPVTSCDYEAVSCHKKSFQRTLHAFHMRVPSLLCSLNHSSILFLSPMSSSASLGSKTTAHVAWPRYSGRCQGQLIWPHVGYVRIYTQIIAQILFHPTVHTPLLFSLPLGQIKVVTWPPACPSWRQQLDAIAKVVRKTWHAVRRIFKPGVCGERSLHGRPNSQFARLLAWATLQSDQAWSVETIEWVRHLRCLKTQKKGCRRIWFAIISLGEFDGVWALVLRNPYLVLPGLLHALFPSFKAMTHNDIQSSI